jgi:hypothetical protein
MGFARVVFAPKVPWEVSPGQCPEERAKYNCTLKACGRAVPRVGFAARFQRATGHRILTQGDARFASLPWADLLCTFGAENQGAARIWSPEGRIGWRRGDQVRIFEDVLVSSLKVQPVGLCRFFFT